MSKGSSLDQVKQNIPNIFDHQQWSFSPQNFLEEEQATVVNARNGRDALQILRVFPGKQMLPVAARHAGLQMTAYINLVVAGLQGEVSSKLNSDLEAALAPHLPARHSNVKAITVPV